VESLSSFVTLLYERSGGSLPQDPPRLLTAGSPGPVGAPGSAGSVLEIRSKTITPTKPPLFPTPLSPSSVALRILAAGVDPEQQHDL